MKVTIGTIAQSCGVSPATVSRVLANNRNVSKKTRDVVLDKMMELNYAPEKLTRIADRGANRSVLMVLEDAMRISNIEIYRSAGKYLASEGYTLLMCECTKDNRSERIRFARNSFCGCIVIAGMFGNRSLNEFENSDYPLVAVHWCNEWAGIDSVIEDTYKNAYLAVKQLASLGHRNIVLINAPENATGSAESLYGFTASAQQYGLKVGERNVFLSDLSIQSGVEAAGRIVSEMPEVTGIICTNHDVAFGVIRQLKQMGKRIPEDYSVMAYGINSHRAELTMNITSVGSSAEELGFMAGKCIIDKLNENAVSDNNHTVSPYPYTKKIILEPKLIDGETTAPPRQ